MSRFRPSLAQAFVVAMAGLALLLGVLFASLVRVSERGLIRSSEERRLALSARIISRVDAYLSQAQQAVTRVESRLRLVAAAHDQATLESLLFAEMLDNPNLAELAFTGARREGFEADGRPRLLATDRFRVSVYRETADASGPILTRLTEAASRGFSSRVRRRPAGGRVSDGRLETIAGEAPDPTDHPTFRTPASEAFGDRAIWSDLSYSELDLALPEPDRRVVVTVLRAVKDTNGVFLGVLRAAILEGALDALTMSEGEVPERTFLCDGRGRLLTRLSDLDTLVDEDGELRIVSADAPPEVTAALARPEVAEAQPGRVMRSGRFELSGRAFLFSFQALPATQDWRLGMVVAEDDLPGLAELRAEQHSLQMWALGLMGLILLGGFMGIRWVGHDLGGILVQSRRMGDFDFTANEPRATFREVASVLGGLEQAKTALRALGKYVPVALVRDLFKANREPALGGEARVLTMMFTDIKSFTTYAEQLSPDVLADALGRYLQVMTEAVHRSGGTIDKYIGDAVMALWNAPALCDGHEVRACRAALACVAATDALYAAPDWGDHPQFVTRFGIHTGEVMVGHFGAPDRLSYTALGDGVNLAARLEGLNKQYGTTILVSEATRAAAGDSFVFRKLDLVAVKGKHKGVLVFELLGEASMGGPRVAQARAYEEAFDQYYGRSFTRAIPILEAQAEDDPPSQVLLARCREYVEAPPPVGWDGVYVARSK